MQYSRAVDGLRGIAILLVLLFHFDFLVPFGWVGVQLFFVLSGFLITSILLKEKSNPLPLYLKRFYWRRTLRIFPLYYLYLGAVGIIYLLGNIPQDYLNVLPFLATYTFNLYPLIESYSYSDYFFIHFWSLSVEEQFYLVWPILIFACSLKQLRVVLIILIVLSPLVRFLLTDLLLESGLEPYYVGETVYRFTFSQWDGFAFGALIPVFSLDKVKIPISKLLLFSSFAVVFLGIWNLYSLHQEGVDISWASMGYRIGETKNLQHVWSYTVLDVLFLLLILYSVNIHLGYSWIRDKILSGGFLVYFGKISYGLYVYHWIIWMAYSKFLKSVIPFSLAGFVLFTSMSVVIASVSYFIVEKPLLGLKDRFFSSEKKLL